MKVENEPDESLAGFASIVLNRARRLIQRGWTQDAWATDDTDKPVSFMLPTAQAFCLTGAIERAIAELLSEEQTATSRWHRRAMILPVIMQRLVVPLKIGDDLTYRQMAVWNDHPERTQEEVLAVIDRAIDPK